MKVCCICGARPNFMKVAAVVEAMARHLELEPVVVHTGQHYDDRLSRVMFEELRLPRPRINLEVGSGSHAQQTAAILSRFEPVLLAERPDLVLVVGDVNSTVACGLAAVKLGIPVGHVEAGLRSFDRSMPEEVNRVITDALSHLLFVSERSGLDNLRREGVPDDCLFFVGNLMIDTLRRHRDAAAASRILEQLGLEPGGYAVLTLHRPANVDDPRILGPLLAAVDALSARLPVVFPVHPRTRSRLTAVDMPGMGAPERWRLTEPLGYLDFLRLTSSARLLLTDSGGIQEEATVLEVPCLTLRPNTERPATLESGWNRLVGTDPAAVQAAAEEILDSADPRAPGASGVPERWDGRAGERLARVLVDLGVGGLRRVADRRQARREAPRRAPAASPVALSSANAAPDARPVRRLPAAAMASTGSA